MHQRQAVLTNISAEKLWKDCSSTVQTGQNIRWTLAGCQFSEIAEDTILKEGARFSILSTAIERNPLARKKCIEHYGYTCAACDINMESKYGRIGKNFIHVHHRTDLASIKGIHRIDPLSDLIPLCPNCHAMIHKEKPAMSLDKLRAILREHA